MQKKTLKFSFYLILFSFLAKILSFFSRIVLARNITALAMSYYTIISPTIVILISAVQMGVPAVLSKLVAEKNYRFKVLSTSIYFTIFTTSLTCIIFLLFIPYLTHLLYKYDYSILFYSVLPFLPLVALSGLLKGYLMGRQKFISSSLSQIIEELVRIIFLWAIFHFVDLKDPIQMAQIAILSASVGEFASSVYMLLVIFFEKHTIFRKPEYSTTSLKSILQIALPMSGSRFIGSISYFLEPIFMNINLSVLQSHTLLLSYGLLNGYVLPLLTMPTFLTIALSNFLLPSFTYHYSRNNEDYANKLFFRILYICFFAGILYSLLLFFFSDQICLLFYENTEASFFLKLCAFPFMVYSLQPILGNMLHAMGKSKASTLDTFSGSIARLLIVAIFTPILKEYALILALIVGMLITTVMHLYHVMWK